MGKSKYGFAKVEKVTAAVLRSRIKFLENLIASGKLTKAKAFAAGKTAAYYRHQLKHDKRFSSKRSTASRKAA